MIRVTSEPFDPSEELKSFEVLSQGTGAIVSFLGRVRSESGDDPVRGLHLEHFPGMTEKSVAEIAAAAQRRWNIEKYLVIHRTGDLEPGEPIVLVCVGAAHRRDAFEAADFLMDYLKTRALFWKKETRDSGARWIEPRKQDYEDAGRWQD